MRFIIFNKLQTIILINKKMKKNINVLAILNQKLIKLKQNIRLITGFMRKNQNLKNFKKKINIILFINKKLIKKTK